MSWAQAMLGDIATIQSGAGFPKKYQGKKEGAFPFFKVSDMNSLGNEQYLRISSNMISDTVRNQLGARIFPTGSIVFPKVGGAISTNKKRIIAQESCVDNNVMGLIPDTSKVTTEYLWYFMQTVDLLEMSNKANPPSIRQSTVNEWKISLPPLPEQNRIVTILDEAVAAIETAVSNTEKNLANASEIYKSHLNQLFSVRGAAWERRPIVDLCENLDRKRVPITKAKRIAGDIPYYGASGIVDHVAEHIFDERLLLVSEDGANLLARTYPIAFSISGKSWVNNHAHVLRFSDLDSQRFVEYYLNSISLDSFVSGMAQPKLNQKSLNSIPVPFPDAEVRRQVVAEISDLQRESRDLAELYQQKSASLAKFGKSCLQKALSGELTSNPVDEAILV